MNIEVFMTTNMRFGSIGAVNKPMFTFGNSISKFSVLIIGLTGKARQFLYLD